MIIISINSIIGCLMSIVFYLFVLICTKRKMILLYNFINYDELTYVSYKRARPSSKFLNLILKIVFISLFCIFVLG